MCIIFNAVTSELAFNNESLENQTWANKHKFQPGMQILLTIRGKAGIIALYQFKSSVAPNHGANSFL
jgi:hypothetical protein